MCTTLISVAIQHQENAAGTGPRAILRRLAGAGRRGRDGGAAAADARGRPDAAGRAGGATPGAAALLRAGYVGDGEAAGNAQEPGGGPAGAVLRSVRASPDS